MSNNLLILDLETDSVDIAKANIKFIGLYDINKDKYAIEQWSNINKKELQDKLLKDYDFIITFNGENYDIPILARDDTHIIIPYWKHIDIFNVFKKRAVLIKSGGFKSYSLNNILKEVGINDEKKEIDYKTLCKDTFNVAEIIQITEYLKHDLFLTNELWKYLVNRFDGLKAYISDKDIKNYKHITSSSGVYAYKAICNMLNIKEEYDDIEGTKPFEGAYIMQPKGETYRENILYFDFASLYPMMYIHSNLFSHNCDCCKQEEKWHGNNDIKIDGYYCSKKQGKKEELVKHLYLKRKELKKAKDKREYAIKIILNSLYGISSKACFKNIYHENIASDCTSLARFCINYAIKTIEKEGHLPIYADTDSCIVKVPDNKTKEECIKLSKTIANTISNMFPFPWSEFDFKLEDDIVYLQFFKDNADKTKKKNYIYINKNNEIIIKGLDVIKKDCSELGRHIFFNHLKQEIIKRKDCKFSKEYIDKLISSHIERNKLIISKRFNIKDFKDYKSKTSIYYTIREKYGEGEINLIKNYKIGVGKGIKYCSFKDAEKLKIEDLNLEDVYKELNPFIIQTKEQKTKSLTDYQ